MSVFSTQITPHCLPEKWLKKQKLIRKDKPTVCGVLLFSDEPQAILPKRSGIKIYRYKTESDEGVREGLDFRPITVEGCVYEQIQAAVQKTIEIVQELSKLTDSGFTKVKYPPETLHEIITNAVLHRDYSIPDDIHIRIYENRIEVQSPGKLPGSVTVNYILEERSSRNGNLVRLINKFPDAPNQDIGEGLNTAFREMQKLHLKDPIIEQKNNKVIVYIHHEPLASLEETIMNLLESNELVTRSIIKKHIYIDSDHRLNKAIKQLTTRQLIEKESQSRGAYKKYKVRSPLLDRLRPYQIEAIELIKNKLDTEKNNKVLISITNGLGKGSISLALVYFFLKERVFDRVYCLVENTSLKHSLSYLFQNREISEHGSLSSEYGVSFLSSDASLSSKVFIGTAQDFGRYSKNLSDSNNNQTKVLTIIQSDNISANIGELISTISTAHIGICSFPSKKLLNVCGEIKYTYSYEQAIQDNYLVPYEQTNIRIDLSYIFPKIPAKYQEVLLSEEVNRNICDEIIKGIDIESKEKTVIFCSNIQHAELVCYLLKTILGEQKSSPKDLDSLISVITSNSSNSFELVRRFCNEPYPKIAVTTNLLASISPIPYITKLIFIRRVSSPVLYNQMLSLGSMPCEEIGKQKFSVLDFSDFDISYDQNEFLLEAFEDLTDDNSKEVPQGKYDEEDSQILLDLNALKPDSNEFAKDSALFKEFISEHEEKITALKLALKQPWQLTRVQLKYLVSEIEQDGFSIESLYAHYGKGKKGCNKQDSIIGLIRYVSLGEKSIPYAERVELAKRNIIDKYGFDNKQTKWLDRISKQLEIEYIVDHDSLERGAFAASGGFPFLDKVFDGNLMEILENLHLYIWNASK